MLAPAKIGPHAGIQQRGGSRRRARERRPARLMTASGLASRVVGSVGCSATAWYPEQEAEPIRWTGPPWRRPRSTSGRPARGATGQVGGCTGQSIERLNYRRPATRGEPASPHEIESNLKEYPRTKPHSHMYTYPRSVPGRESFCWYRMFAFPTHLSGPQGPFPTQNGGHGTVGNASMGRGERGCRPTPGPNTPSRHAAVASAE